jgi:NAD(P)-dependent dehydrogenase (short-subunit alcohol dehydrogenase family)
VRGTAIAPVYSLTKAAVHGWTRAVAQAWGRDGIVVNALCPAVETPGVERMRAHLGPEASAAIEAHIEAIMPVRGALGDPVGDLGPMLVFLAGDGARFMTGQAIAVDGGILMLAA